VDRDATVSTATSRSVQSNAVYECSHSHFLLFEIYLEK
jgi:hypothetical protein